jgi:hypothetical protein
MTHVILIRPRETHAAIGVVHGILHFAIHEIRVSDLFRVIVIRNCIAPEIHIQARGHLDGSSRLNTYVQLSSRNLDASM